MKHIYTSVDIGSDSIKVVTSELFKGKLNLLAASSVKSKGIKKGLITDVNSATMSLQKAISEVENMLGIKIKKVITTIPSYFAEFTKIDGEIKINNENKIVTGDDVVKVLGQAVRGKISSTKEMVTIVPIDFSVDSKTGIKDPKGLSGETLGIKVLISMSPKEIIYKTLEVLKLSGIEVMDIGYSSIITK